MLCLFLGLILPTRFRCTGAATENHDMSKDRLVLPIAIAERRNTWVLWQSIITGKISSKPGLHPPLLGDDIAIRISPAGDPQIPPRK